MSRGFVTPSALAVWGCLLAGSAIAANVEFGLYRSIDRGSSWIRVGREIPRDVRINAVSAVGQAAIAGTDRGIFVSQDGGVTWRRSGSGAGETTRVLAVVAHGARVFAGTRMHGVLASADGGASWKAANAGLSDHHVRSLLSADGRLYAGTDAKGVFVSVDDGRSWTSRSVGLPGFSQVHALAAIDGVVFAGLYSKGLHRWDESIASWVDVGDVRPFSLAAAGGILLVGHNGDRGVVISADLGRTWRDGNAGLPFNPPIWAMGVDRERIYVGTSRTVAPGSDDLGLPSDGLFVSADRGASWSRSDTGLPLNSSAVAFAVTKEFVLAGIVTRGTGRVGR